VLLTLALVAATLALLRWGWVSVEWVDVTP
jgi:hypothetical protein